MTYVESTRRRPQAGSAPHGKERVVDIKEKVPERDPRRDGCPAERLAFWRERLIRAEQMGRPAHIAHVKARVEELEDIRDVPWFNRGPGDRGAGE